MSLNDTNILKETAKGDVYPGIANPTKASGKIDPMKANFVSEPTAPSKGAGAGSNFEGHKDAKRAMKGSHGLHEPKHHERPGVLEKGDAHARKEHFGVIESHPGIIETTDIDPLHHETKP